MARRLRMTSRRARRPARQPTSRRFATPHRCRSTRRRRSNRAQDSLHDRQPQCGNAKGAAGRAGARRRRSHFDPEGIGVTPPPSSLASTPRTARAQPCNLRSRVAALSLDDRNMFGNIPRCRSVKTRIVRNLDLPPKRAKARSLIEGQRRWVIESARVQPNTFHLL